MPFQPGHKKFGGKKKGSRNKRTVDFLSVLEQQNFCPASAQIECYNEAKKIYDSYGTIYDAIADAREASGQFVTPLEDKAHVYLKIASDIAKDLSSYAYPKLKSTEHTKPDPTLGMSPVQRLEMMEHFLKLLRIEVHGSNLGSIPILP